MRAAYDHLPLIATRNLIGKPPGADGHHNNLPFGREAGLRSSPLLEAYKARGLEVLVMDDEIDELVASSIGKFMEIDLNAVNRSATADDLSSSRLADSPSCIVVDEHDPTMQMQQILKMMGNRDLPEAKPILEINPSHPIVTKLAGVQDEAVIDDMSRLLLDQALLVEGAELKDPAAFVRRLNRALEKSL